jgi:hypothetical protein
LKVKRLVYGSQYGVTVKFHELAGCVIHVSTPTLKLGFPVIKSIAYAIVMRTFPVHTFLYCALQVFFMNFVLEIFSARLVLDLQTSIVGLCDRCIAVVGTTVCFDLTICNAIWIFAWLNSSKLLPHKLPVITLHLNGKV